MERAHHPSIQKPLERFSAFWAVLDSVRVEIGLRKWGSPQTGGQAESPDSQRYFVDMQFRRLREAILAYGGAPAPRTAYAQAPLDLGYIMSALADEILLYFDKWDGVSLWGPTLLEERLYGTRNAGERLYDEIELLLARRTGENDEIAIGLLLAVSLGFRGRNRLLPSLIEIEAAADRLRDRLYQSLFYRPPPPLPDWRAAMDYPPAFESGQLIRLPRLRSWVLVFGVCLLAYLAASHVIWAHSFADLLRTADQIKAAGPELTKTLGLK